MVVGRWVGGAASRRSGGLVERVSGEGPHTPVRIGYAERVLIH